MSGGRRCRLLLKQLALFHVGSVWRSLLGSKFRQKPEACRLMTKRLDEAAGKDLIQRSESRKAKFLLHLVFIERLRA